jgi:hypothetical protein
MVVTARPLTARTLTLMADHISQEAVMMVLGNERWIHKGDILAGRASLQSARALIEFLIGRGGKHKDSDIQPTDYCVGWRPGTEHSETLRARLTEIDRLLAHLSLDRVEPREIEPDTDGHHSQTAEPPEGWGTTITRIVDLLETFTKQAGAGPGIDRLQDGVERARALSRPRSTT